MLQKWHIEQIGTRTSQVVANQVLRMLFPGRKERLGLQNFKILHKPMVNVRKHLKEVQTITPLESGLAMRSRYLTFLTRLACYCLGSLNLHPRVLRYTWAQILPDFLLSYFLWVWVDSFPILSCPMVPGPTPPASSRSVLPFHTIYPTFPDNTTLLCQYKPHAKLTESLSVWLIQVHGHQT